MCGSPMSLRCLLERLELCLQVRDLTAELGELATLVDEFGGEVS